MKKLIVLLTMLILSLNISAKSNSKTANQPEEKTKDNVKITVIANFKTAIKVNTVEEEYEYLSAKYPGSKVLGQALVYDDNGTPYDILTVQMPDGKTVKYYFDVTEVFKGYEKMFGL